MKLSPWILVPRALYTSLFLVAFFGCKKPPEETKPAPAPLAASASASAAAPPAPTPGKAASYSGTYSVAPGRLYIPATKDYASVKQAKDDPTKHVGEGALVLVVDAEGRVTGTIDSGPASPAIIDGALVDGELRGTVRRKDPKDDGLTGTFIGKITGNSVAGMLSLAEANAAIVREGKFSLDKK